MFRFAFAVLLFAVVPCAGARAQDDSHPSRCMAIARALPGTFNPVIWRVNASPQIAAESGEVTITYAGHSTYVIESPQGVRIATDFSGAYGSNPVPRLVTMNKAHSTHFTLLPDPAIEHVLKGWSPDGGPAKHRLVVDDVFIRNVTTDIRGNGGMEADGNSIFIFELADLCIGHLGHLHHQLDDSDYAAIGRLDVVMVPIDGGLTLSQAGMSDIVKRMRSSLVLPMHRRFTTIDGFLNLVSADFDIRFLRSRTLAVSLRTLPSRPTVMIPDGL